MRTIRPICLLLVSGLLLSSLGQAENHQPSKAYTDQLVLVHENLVRELANSENLINHLTTHKECKTTLAEVFEKDTRWLVSKSLQQDITGNKIAAKFKRVIANDEYSIVEFILTDGLGATVSAWPLPSDYWQGDEAKFIQPVKQQKYYISDARWDESSEAYSFFLAEPIYMEGELLGVLIAGIDVTIEYIMRMPFDQLVKLQVKPTPDLN
jgi:hypothetical protein